MSDWAVKPKTGLWDEEMQRAASVPVPTIHSNGTSKESLVAALSKAYEALGVAYDALRETAPHGRDYYPQGPGALEIATAAHMSRLRRVDDVRDEIERLAIVVDEQ